VSKSKNQKQTRDRCTGEFHLRLVVDDTHNQGQHPRVHAGGPDAAGSKIVGEKSIARGCDLDQAYKDPLGGVDNESKHDEGRGVPAHRDLHLRQSSHIIPSVDRTGKRTLRGGNGMTPISPTL
jgi:hypothetical protein